MAPRKPLTVFLIEHYRPGHGVDDLLHCVRQIQVQLQETAGASLLCSVVVPIDEAFLLVVAATSEQAVQAAYARAGTTFDRISTAVADLAVPRATGPGPALRRRPDPAQLRQPLHRQRLRRRSRKGITSCASPSEPF